MKGLVIYTYFIFCLLCDRVSLAVEETGVCAPGDQTCKNVAAAEAVLPKGANADGRPLEASDDCVDRHQQCVGFAQHGECVKNPGWMIVVSPK